MNADHPLEIRQRADELMRHSLTRSSIHTDRIFLVLLLSQWTGAIVLALTMTPTTWIGSTAHMHIHVGAAIGFGALLSAFPVAMILCRPGQAATAYVVAIAQSLWSALLIDITGGRIETHFHVFCSLALLSFYRSPRVLLAATAVTALDHLTRGVLWPPSVFGVFVESPWRWVEHTAWVGFEDIVLIFAMRHSLNDLQGSCLAQAHMESTNQQFEEKVNARTREIKKSQEFLRHVLDAIDVSVCITDAEGHILATNNGWDELVVAITATDRDFSMEATYQEHLSQIATETHHDDILVGIQGVLAGTSDSYRQKLQVQLRDHFAWHEVRVSRLTHERAVGVIAHLDVTPHVLAEEQLRSVTEEAERLALVAKYTDNGVVITDRYAHIEWANDGFTRISGYELNEVIGMKPGSFLQGKETDPLTVQKMRRAIQNGVGFDVELRNYRKDGSPYDVTIECRPIRDESGQTIRFIGVQSDVTTQRAAQAQRNAERELMHTILEHVPGCIFWKDTNLVYRGCNRTFARFAGLQDSKSVIGRTDFEMPWGPSDAEFYRHCDAEVMRLRRPMLAFEEPGRDPQGNMRTLLTSKVPLLNASGEVEGMVGIFTDISALKHAQVEHDRLQRELSDVARRAGMAEVATGVLHNVGNVLNSINVSVQQIHQTLRATRLNGLSKLAGRLSEASRSSETAAQECEKALLLLPPYIKQLAAVWDKDRDQMTGELSQLTTLVDHVKDVIRIQQDYARGGSHIEAIDLTSTIDDALTTIRDAPVAASIQIESSVDQRHNVRGDRHKLLQILINLVSNATHALLVGESRERRISIRVDQDDVTTSIAVEDNGVGIAEEDMTKVFQLGFTTRKNGHGFGLHSSALLAIEMDGKLTVESQGRGRGATFTLAFPHLDQNTHSMEKSCRQSQYAHNEC